MDEGPEVACETARGGQDVIRPRVRPSRQGPCQRPAGQSSPDMSGSQTDRQTRPRRGGGTRRRGSADPGNCGWPATRSLGRVRAVPLAQVGIGELATTELLVVGVGAARRTARVARAAQTMRRAPIRTICVCQGTTAATKDHRPWLRTVAADDDQLVTTVTLSTDQSERVVCPRRGSIDLEWCLGCPRRVSVEHVGDQTVIVCDPGIPAERYQRPGPDAWSGHGRTGRGVTPCGSDQPRSATRVFIELRQLALWPLRRAGVDPGRAVANARPQPGQLRVWRREQLAYITDRIAAVRRPSRAVTGNASGIRSPGDYPQPNG
jgi:hypothetical protein